MKRIHEKQYDRVEYYIREDANETKKTTKKMQDKL